MSSDPTGSSDARRGPPHDATLGTGPRNSGGLDDTASEHLLDRSHTTPPHLVADLAAEELRRVGGRDVAFWMQDYDQQRLQPVPIGGDIVADVESIDGSLAGRSFALHTAVERIEPDGATRIWLPMLGGAERLGVMALTLDELDDDRRGHVRRLAANIAHLFFSKGMYTDEYSRIRRRKQLRLAAEMQWALLPPLTITTPYLSIAGLLEPAYEIAGDSFDYAVNEEGLHFAIFDAMGHGLASAIMATTAVAAYRHARRSGVALEDMYGQIDVVLADQFGIDTFATAQLAMLDPASGLLSWVNAGHPAPLLVRGHKAVRFLPSEPTVPVGFGGATPAVATEQLEPGDRLLFFTDGVVEHRNASGEMFGEDRLAEHLVRHLSEQLPGAEVLRRLNRDLLEIIGTPGHSDDATLVLVHWTGPESDLSLVPPTG